MRTMTRGNTMIGTSLLALLAAFTVLPGCGEEQQTPAVQDDAAKSADERLASPSPAVKEDIEPKRYRAEIGSASPKIRKDGEKTYLWAGGAKPGLPEAKWYDFTNATIPPEKLQFGIGKDAILSIDDPLFVATDDERLLLFGSSPYRPEEGTPKIPDEMRVIGYAEGGIAKAYPVSLLDRHELVNTKYGEKPVTVGW